MASPAVEALSPAGPFVVCFGAGSTAISSSGAKALEAAAAQSQRMGRRSRLEVEARTDAAEARSHGINLSADRGSAIRARLMLLGVPTEHIQIKAFADSAPLSESNREDPQNRCATIWLSSAP
ncbi:OmpA family protein [Reyranella sp.]|uniref:OmpA family protein n=1 Tax=Reyranella sp. TaxID=1929291 RepID=UPI004036C2D2